MDNIEHTRKHVGKEVMKNLIAGGMGAMISRSVCQPLEVIKVRIQVYPNRYRTMMQTTTTLYKEEGVRGLWKGHTLAQASVLFAGAAQFIIFEELNRSITVLDSNPNAKNFVCGFLTGIIAVMVLSPIEMLKTRIVAQECSESKSAVKMFKNLIRVEGFRGIYKGAFTSMIHIGPLVGTKFMIYNLICNTAIQDTDDNVKNEVPTSVMLLAGGGSGVISNAITYPVEVIKRRMQVGGLKGGFIKSCTKIMKCFSNVLHDDGFHGFYKGLQPNLLKSAIESSITFCSFHKIKAGLNHLDTPAAY